MTEEVRSRLAHSEANSTPKITKRTVIPIITVEHLRDGTIAHENLPLVGKSDFQRLRRYKLMAGDLVFSRVGAIDRCAFVSPAEDGWLFSG